MNISVRILLILLFFSFTNLIFSQNNQLQNQLRLARLFESSGKLEDAEKIYTELYNVQPKNYQFYNSLYKILIKQKKYEEALRLTQNQIDLNKKNTNLFGDLGSTYFLMGNERKAISIWEDALNIEPDNAFAYKVIANYLIENRLIDKALEVLNKANAVSDDPTIFSYDIANLYSLTMKYEKATEEYCKIILQKPKQLNLVKNRIIGYINSNKAEEPTLKTVENIYNDGENITILKLLGELYFRTNNIEKAFDTTEKIEEETVKNGSVLFSFAQKSTRLGVYKISAKAYNKIIIDYPESALYSEAELGYTRSLEADLKSTTVQRHKWEPLIIDQNMDEYEYGNLINAYEKLNKKYSRNKIGWEAEFRIAQIYFNNLKQLEKSDSIFTKIVTEVRSLSYLDESNFGLAQIALKNDDLHSAEGYLLKVTKSRIAKRTLKSKTNFLMAKVKMWQGNFSESLSWLNKVRENPKDPYVNDALQYSLILSTFKNDSTNLFSFSNADYLVEKGEFDIAANEFKNLADNNNLYLLKDFAALRYIELIIALNNYKEAVIFLEEISNCDEDNIYKDRFLYLLGSCYYYGMQNNDKALLTLTIFFDEFPNSIYFNKARKIISEINAGARKTI